MKVMNMMSVANSIEQPVNPAVTIMTYPFKEMKGGDVDFVLFGKSMPVLAASNQYRVVVHDHYPMITQADIGHFIDYVIIQKALVVSACEAEVHPYRILTADADGRQAFLVDVPQGVRGDRHQYPDVFSFRPALIGIPPGFGLDDSLPKRTIKLCIFPREKLLDRTNRLEALMVENG